MNRDTELWSIKKKRAYPAHNATQVKVGGVYCLATEEGELLVSRVI